MLRARSAGVRVALTIALPTLALLICEWLRSLLDPVFDAPFIAAVAITAWICGIESGVAALFLSAALLDYFFLPPLYSFRLAGASAVVRFFAFLGANAIILALIANVFRARTALAYSEQLSKNLSELIPFGGWVCDGEGQMLWLSDSFLHAFHRTMQDCSGMGWLDVVHEAQRSHVREQWKNCMSEGYFWNYEYRMVAPDGEEFIVLSRGVPVRSPLGQVTSWVGVHLDITERERSAEQRVRHARDVARFNAELDQLAYVSAHDLQEPLRMIASYLQLLSRRYKGQLDADADAFIQYAVDGAERLKALLQDLLLLQQVGKSGRPRSRHDLRFIAEKAIRNLALGEEEVSIQVAELPSIVCDELELTQLFENLIGNACKYAAEARKPEIRIDAKREGEFWEVSVRDNGIGIDPAFLDRIFNVFQRLHASARYPGTGIGLAICKKIVEVHGGRIRAESEPGAGSTFYFTLPV